MSTSFISTEKVTLLTESNFITLESFAGWVALDIGLVAASFLLWRFLFYSLDKLWIVDI